MVKNTVIQVPADGDFLSSFDDYMKSKGHSSRSKAAKELLEFALRIVNNPSDDGVSNRELLEKIFRSVKEVSSLSKMNHAHCYSRINRDENAAESAAERKLLMDRTSQNIDNFLSGNDAIKKGI